MSDWIETIKPFLKLSKEQIEALTAWAEARGEGKEGMQAVICVIRNRAKKGGWFVSKDIAALSTPIHGVALKHFQFSSFLPADPNYQKLLRFVENWQPDIYLREALEIANDADAEDITHGATYYHTKAISPAWAKTMIRTAEIGSHIFYREPE